jgi:hypothetical protein
LWAWCRGLPTQRYRHNVGVILTFGLGGGLTGQELSYLIGTDVTADTEGVVIDVGRHRPRQVPVLHRWEELVADLAAQAGDGPIFLPQRRGITRRQIPNFVARCPKGDAPALNMVRLRVTWMVGLLEMLPVTVVEAAAGVEPGQLARYADYVERPGADEIRRMIRWAGER